MTTGSSGVSGSTNTTSVPGLYYERTWSGGDGKTEPYAGGIRTKWNNYGTFQATRQVNNARWRGEIWTNWPSKPAVWDPFFGGGLYYPQGIGSNLSMNARDLLGLQSKLVQKVKGHDFNLAVNVAQLGLTVTMMADTLTKLGKSILALKHGDFSTAARQLGARPRTSSLKSKDVSGRWLELQYGWLPLISDSFEAAKAFHEISQGPRKAIFRTSISKERLSVDTTGLGTSTGLERLSTYLEYEMYEEMSVGRQLGMTDPLSVIWEVVPYSFVVDWFVPFGTYLDNLNSIPKLIGRFLTTTVRRKNGFSFAWTPSPSQVERFRYIKAPDVRYRSVDLSRIATTSLTVPLPGSFDLSGITHGKRLWNAIALAYQAFGR